MNIILQNGKIPDSWKEVNAALILKEGHDLS